MLEFALTEAQLQAGDVYAKSFRTIHANLDKAFEATGIVDPDGGTTAGATKSAAKSRFASLSQHFFG